MAKTSLIYQQPDYKAWITDLKTRFASAQVKAAISVNVVLLEFYWQLGEEIHIKQAASHWGAGLLTQLSQDLKAEFPDIKGFSKRNLEEVRRWYRFYAVDHAIAQQAVAQLQQIPWSHNLVIVTKSSSLEEALYYVQMTQKHGWSRVVLVHQIESQLWQREGKAITNFAYALPSPQSELAQQTLKDPYLFDFIALTKDYTERDIETALVQHITQFLLELGAGFAYMGRQVPLEVSNQEFFLDLLFYHVNLQCYVVIELKTTSFMPEHAGKLNFYIKAVDELMKKPTDNPTIGLLLCKEKDQIIAEWALSDINKPIGVSGYELTKQLPTEFQSKLPTIEQIEKELDVDLEADSSKKRQGENE